MFDWLGESELADTILGHVFKFHFRIGGAGEGSLWNGLGRFDFLFGSLVECVLEEVFDLVVLE